MVKVATLFDQAVSPGTLVEFTINQIFSPPTTEPIDEITVTTYSASPTSASNYKIDTLVATISDLTPHSLALAMSSSVSPVINSAVGLVFSWTLPDTITKNDYIEVEFPQVGQFNLITLITNTLNLTGHTYNAATFTLKTYQTSSASNKLKSQSVGFTALTYTTPSSVQTTPPFTLRVLNNNYLKMSGQATITTVPKQYTSTVSTVSTTINAQTSYTISFSLADPLSNSGYMVVYIPKELTLAGTYSVSIAGTSIAASPTHVMDISAEGVTFFTLTKLNISSASIPTQSISITINGLIQPGSVQSISSFTVSIFYSSAKDVVAEAKNTNTITTTAGQIVAVSVALSSTKNSNTPVLYTFSVSIANKIPQQGTLSITLPAEAAVLSGGQCTVNTVVLAAASCLITGQTIKFTTPSELAGQTTVVLSYSHLTNPVSTKPATIQNVQTANSAAQTIDVLPTSLKPQFSTSSPSDISSATLVRGSKENSKATLYSLNVTQVYAIVQSEVVIKVSLPEQVTVDPS